MMRRGARESEVTQVIAGIDDKSAVTNVSDEVTITSEFDSLSTDVTRAVVSEQEPRTVDRQAWWLRLAAFGILPGIAVILVCGAGYMKWQWNSAIESATARAQTLTVATESTIALLSYRHDTAETQLTAARELLTGDFRDSYTSLIDDVVIPGAKQQQISAIATVPAVASLSANASRAEVLVFINQSVTVGTDAPTSTASSVKVTLDKIGDRWLISDFVPV
jgi:Mce-associated membrane protein